MTGRRTFLLLIILALAAMPAAGARAGLVQKALDGGANQIIFAIRGASRGNHWYENFGQDAKGQGWMYGVGGGRLCRLDLRSGVVTNLLDDPAGGVRDPQVSYDGRKILFSYRPGGTDRYHLQEINADGTGLRQITGGDAWDNIEPTYTPAGDIVFASSRCRSFVPCWFSQVAVLFRCGPDGRNIQPISTNMEQENTPAILPDGRVLYMRWEYIDRDQLAYHHLWTMNPDGTGVNVYFGNMHGGGAFLGAKPVPGTGEVLMVYSPGHGRREHAGRVALADAAAGPDEQGGMRFLTEQADFRDPYPLTKDLFIIARGKQLLLMDRAGATEVIHTLAEGDANWWVHEPQALRPRPREPILADRVDSSQSTGTFVLADVYRGRNMAGLQPREIRKLLVLEPLPKPINFNGWEDALSYERGYIMHRILGTVPVEADGSAHFEVPARRPVFFVALDERDRAVKRMRSFTSAMPGETVGCVGCHEYRTEAPPTAPRVQALHKPAAAIAPIPGAPQVMDFPRDIQPILDRHCIRCHNYDAPPPADLPLVGARGPWFSHSYYALLKNGLAFQRVYGAPGNDPPRLHGSYTAKLLKTLEAGHHEVNLSAHEKMLLRLWIDTGSQYCGTYAALGTGMTPLLVSVDTLTRRCGSCHEPQKTPPPGRPAAPLTFKASYGDLFYQHLSVPKNFATAANWETMRAELPTLGDHGSGGERFYNLTDPIKSPILLAPLAKSAGGWGVCKNGFANTTDPDYQQILSDIRATKAALDQIKRFDMPGFRPGIHYIREMKRYGLLPADFDALRDPIDAYEMDERYWRSFWHEAAGQ